MGAYSYLCISDCIIDDVKYSIRLESLLAFSPGDYIEKTAKDGKTRQRRGFLTSVRNAKKNLDSKGLDLAFFRSVFLEFRSDFLVFQNMDNDPEEVRNTITYKKYTQVLHRWIKTRKYLYLSTEETTRPSDTDFKLVANRNFFIPIFNEYFENINFLLTLRTALQGADEQDRLFLDIEELMYEDIISHPEARHLHEDLHYLALKQTELNYRIYGFALNNDPSTTERVRKIIKNYTEDEFIEKALAPLLKKLGFNKVSPQSFHGPHEDGSDFRPFEYTDPFGYREYLGLQAKSIKIHSNARGETSASINTLISQARSAISTSHIDESDNTRKYLDKFIIATNKTITEPALRILKESLAQESIRRIHYLDINRVVELIIKHDLTHHILFS